MKHTRTAKDSLADTIKARWPKDTLVARLDASLRFCDAALDGAGSLNTSTLANYLLAFETDLAEHYSQLSGYMRLLGLVPPSALPPRTRVAIELSPSELAPYAGVYNLVSGIDLQVTLQNGALFIRSTPDGATVRLHPESANAFFAKEVEGDARVTFTRDASGTVTGLVFHRFGRDRAALRTQ